VSKPAVLDIDIYRGDTTDITLRFRTRVFNAGQGGYTPGDYINLTGYTLRAQVRTLPGSEVILSEFSAVLADQSNVATVGGVVVTLTSVQTGLLPIGTCYWDLQLTAPDGSVKTFSAGAVNVIADVTR
jgi:hypothetical protein